MSELNPNAGGLPARPATGPSPPSSSGRGGGRGRGSAGAFRGRGRGGHGSSSAHRERSSDRPQPSSNTGDTRERSHRDQPYHARGGGFGGGRGGGHRGNRGRGGGRFGNRDGPRPRRNKVVRSSMMETEYGVSYFHPSMLDDPWASLEQAHLANTSSFASPSFPLQDHIPANPDEADLDFDEDVDTSGNHNNPDEIDLDLGDECMDATASDIVHSFPSVANPDELHLDLDDHDEMDGQESTSKLVGGRGNPDEFTDLDLGDDDDDMEVDASDDRQLTVVNVNGAEPYLGYDASSSQGWQQSGQSGDGLDDINDRNSGMIESRSSVPPFTSSASPTPASRDQDHIMSPPSPRHAPLAYAPSNHPRDLHHTHAFMSPSPGPLLPPLHRQLANSVSTMYRPPMQLAAEPHQSAPSCSDLDTPPLDAPAPIVVYPPRTSESPPNESPGPLASASTINPRASAGTTPGLPSSSLHARDRTTSYSYTASASGSLSPPSTAHMSRITTPPGDDFLTSALPVPLSLYPARESSLSAPPTPTTIPLSPGLTSYAIRRQLMREGAPSPRDPSYDLARLSSASSAAVSREPSVGPDGFVVPPSPRLFRAQSPLVLGAAALSAASSSSGLLSPLGAATPRSVKGSSMPPPSVPARLGGGGAGATGGSLGLMHASQSQHQTPSRNASTTSLASDRSADPERRLGAADSRPYMSEPLASPELRPNDAPATDMASPSVRAAQVQRRALVGGNPVARYGAAGGDAATTLRQRRARSLSGGEEGLTVGVSARARARSPLVMPQATEEDEEEERQEEAIGQVEEAELDDNPVKEGS